MFKLNNVIFKNILRIDNLEIQPEKITSIVGKSGSGKTTLLKLLNNMITPEKGLLTYFDTELKELNPIKLRREIIMMPQNPIMFPETIYDNFLKTLEWTESKYYDDIFYNKLLTEVNLSHSLDTQTETLSGGEKQRLALARILLLKPKVLLLDEPSASLDTETEKFIIEMVLKYVKENKSTLVMITHSKSLAEIYSDIIVTLNNGIIEKIEKTEN